MISDNYSKDYSSSGTDLTVLQAARRLRRIQISFANEPASRRKSYISEELDAIIKTLPIDGRTNFLDELESVFPAVNSERGVTLPPVAEITEAKAPATVDELVSELVARSESMNQSEREAVIDRLAKAGLCRVESPAPTYSEKQEEPLDSEDATVRESLKYVKKALHLEHVDVPRLANAVVMLIIYMGQLDDTVWRAWQEVAQKPGLRRKARLNDVLLSYIRGDSSIKGTDLNSQIKATRKLIAAFIAAIGKLGGQFSKQHLAQFSPQEIQVIASRRGGNLLMSQDAVCWALYKSMSTQLNLESVDDAVRNILSVLISDLMNGKGR